MKISNIILLVLVTVCLTNCEKQEDRYPLDKRYWDSNDYSNVVRELKYGYKNDENLPTFNDPQSRLIVEKLTDHNNYLIVLDDEELGVKHRNSVAVSFFNRWRDMSSIYTKRDRKDNYIYDIEMVEVYKFGLELQLRYFELGNKEIEESVADSDSKEVKRLVNDNIRTLIGNFENYLDEINDESAFSEAGRKAYGEGLKKHFSELIELHPLANYNSMEKKLNLIKEKSNSTPIKDAISIILQLIESKKETS